MMEYYQSVVIVLTHLRDAFFVWPRSDGPIYCRSHRRRALHGGKILHLKKLLQAIRREPLRRTAGPERAPSYGKPGRECVRDEVLEAGLAAANCQTVNEMIDLITNAANSTSSSALCSLPDALESSIARLAEHVMSQEQVQGDNEIVLIKPICRAIKPKTHTD